MLCRFNTSPGDFIETNKKPYLQFETEEQKHGAVFLVDTDSDKCDITVERILICKSIVGVLMKKKNNFPPLKPKATNGPVKQYNAIIEFITKKKFGVQVGHFTEYSEFVMRFALVLWEIDPHYHKLQSREKKFPSVVENTFLGYSKPASHGHAVRALSSVSIAVKIEKLFNYIDRGFMAPSHMKSLRDMMFPVANSIAYHLDYISKQNERVKKNHLRNKPPERSIENFTVKNINMKMSSDIRSIDLYQGIKQKLQNVDAYEAFTINELINVKKGVHL